MMDRVKIGTWIGVLVLFIAACNGAAVTAVRIESVLHELSNIPGVLEDVTEINLALKQLVVNMHSDEPKFLELKVE